jgi:hypothetical protein
MSALRRRFKQLLTERVGFPPKSDIDTLTCAIESETSSFLTKSQQTDNMSKVSLRSQTFSFLTTRASRYTSLPPVINRICVGATGVSDSTTFMAQELRKGSFPIKWLNATSSMAVLIKLFQFDNSHPVAIL